MPLSKVWLFVNSWGKPEIIKRNKRLKHYAVHPVIDDSKKTKMWILKICFFDMLASYGYIIFNKTIPLTQQGRWI